MKAFNLIPVLLLFASCATHKLKQTNTIEKVEFSATACFGTCPVFNMSIPEQGVATLDAIRFNKINGKFTTGISKRTLLKLFSMINKADVFSLKDVYTQDVTDLPTYVLSIRYKDGKTKSISDYGPMKPGELNKVYKFLFKLKTTEHWTIQ